MKTENCGILYIVSTPIGNLEDITFRAVRILEEADAVLCEDTRVTKKLLDHYHLDKKLISYFQHSKLSKVDSIIKMLEEGAKLALVTDAGTPGISDPGQSLIAQIQKSKIKMQNYGEHFVLGSINNGAMEQWSNGIRIIPIPGPSALTAAASVSGMIEKEFLFAGFLPKKKGRQTKFRELAKLNTPIVIYESANRLERTLEDIKDYLGSNTEVFIAREITKIYEEFWGGKILEVLRDLENHTMKGEIVLVVKRQGISKS